MSTPPALIIAHLTLAPFCPDGHINRYIYTYAYIHTSLYSAKNRENESEALVGYDFLFISSSKRGCISLVTLFVVVVVLRQDFVTGLSVLAGTRGRSNSCACVCLSVCLRAYLRNYTSFRLRECFLAFYCFQDLVAGLSVLARGSVEEKLEWAFGLYDINGDGVVARDEMLNIVTAIYDMIGRCAVPAIDESAIVQHVDNIFQVDRAFCVLHAG